MDRKWASALALAVAVGLVGCGGSDSDEPERLSQAEFVRKADAACESVRSEVGALGNPRTRREFLQWAAEAKETYARGLRELRSLNPPEEQARLYAELLEAYEARTAAGLEVVSVALIGRRSRTGENKSVQLQQQVAETSDQLGLRACAA